MGCKQRSTHQQDSNPEVNSDLSNTACTGENHPALRARPPAEYAGTIVVGLPSLGTACAFSSRFRDLKLVPVKWCCRVPPTSTPQGHNASRWAQGYSSLKRAM